MDIGLKFARLKKDNNLRTGYEPLAFVEFGKNDIFIPNNQKQVWSREEMAHTQDNFPLEVSSVLSHETLHIVLYNIGERRATEDLDKLFGVSWREQHNETHGLRDFNAMFKPRKNKLRSWGRKIK
jgi:hypothetical protein